MPTLRKVLPKVADYPAHLEACWLEHLAARGADAPTVLSTFAGAGGSSLGYSMAGFREVLAVEWDDNAVQTFKANFPGIPVYHGDIAKLSVDECLSMAGLKPGELDVFDGSPPCQGFSTAGKRIMDDPRNQLFREYVRLLRGLRPKVFVMENVSGMVKGKMRLIFVDILRELKASGYRVSARLLNAMYFGVPQSRQRMIFIGVRDDLGIEPTHPGACTSPITVRMAFVGVEHEDSPRLSPGLAAIAGRIPQWGDGGDVTGGSYFGTKRIGWDRPSRSIIKEMVGTRTALIHPDEPRAVTSREAMRLGSWPGRYVFGGGYKLAMTRIGNSVPPLFMRAIARHIRAEILDKVKR